MARQRKTYSQEYKLKAVRLVIDQKQSATSVARSLGIEVANLRRWVTQYKVSNEQAFPGNGKQSLTEEQQRIKELEAEVRQLKMEQEILKKAAAFFAKDQL